MATPLSEPSSFEVTDQVLAEARRGDSRALGIALELNRSYLLLIAGRELGPDLRAKCSPADLVQETVLKAQRDFADFRGRTEPEFRNWLVGILKHSVLEQRRYFQAQGRDLSKEVSIDAAGPFDGRDRAFQDDSTSPSGKAARREEAALLLRALERLPRREYRVLTWKQWEGCTFEEIGRRLGCSHVNARKIWLRSLENLEKELAQLKTDLS
jgi:RNA polymerase sigma-70 factor, ECF subfamily